MTQAFNLSQFANRINTSGQADPTNVFSSALPVNQGGSNNASLAVTAGGVLYTDGSKFVNVGAGTSGQVLQSNGASAPTWVAPPVYGGSQMVAFYSPGSWSCPSSTSTAIFIAIGGGGGGSRPPTGQAGAGGVAVAIGNGINGSYTITVGAGGNAYQGPQVTGGTPGGTSSIVGTNLNITATGGTGTGTAPPSVSTSPNGTRGTGTVTTGTAIRATGSSGATPAVTPIFLAGGGIESSAGTSTSPAAQAYSATQVVAAGSGGWSAVNPSGGSGGIGGACFIIY